MHKWIRLHPEDDVIVLLKSMTKGDILVLDEYSDLILLDEVPKGHKVATRKINQGEDVIKFGYSIGIAKCDIEAGSWIHTHNMRTGLVQLNEYSYDPAAIAMSNSVVEQARTGENRKRLELDKQRTFQGYQRIDGEVGIRNEIWIINTVGCINKTCELVARRASLQYENRVDGVSHYAHPFGCSQLGDDLVHTQKLLASLVHHGNAAGVLVIGLGCENNQIDLFKKAIGHFDPQRVKFLRSQDSEDEIEDAMALIDELVIYAEQFKRVPISIDRLKLGLKCGGSDGLSGITANPLVGVISDRLIEAGGTTILTEVPEMFGAETILMKRATNEAVFQDIVALINDFKQYFIRHNQEIYENPSPGNKDGGISTLEEKSLGCTQKGGHAIVKDVLAYGEKIRESGLSLLEAPGNDLVSVTALSASGAHIVLFTTGRGTPFGGPVPTVKIATNSELANRKKNWIDFDAGRLLEDSSMEQLSDELWEQLIQLASGERQTHNERNGFKEIAIFKDGVIM